MDLPRLAGRGILGAKLAFRIALRRRAGLQAAARGRPDGLAVRIPILGRILQRRVAAWDRRCIRRSSRLRRLPAGFCAGLLQANIHILPARRGKRGIGNRAGGNSDGAEGAERN